MINKLNSSLINIENMAFAFFKKYWKEILIIVAILIAVFSIKACNESKQRIKDLESAAHFNDSLSNSKITEYKDENGKLHVQVDDLFTDNFALGSQLDSIKQSLNEKNVKITAISKTVTHTVVNEKLRVDTITNIAGADSTDNSTVSYNFHWKDSWMEVTGSIGAKDSIHVQGIDTLSRVDYWKRKWFLGAKHYYTDFNNSNPHIKVVGYKGAEFSTKEKKFSFGFSVLYGYPVNYIQLKKPVTAVGISLQYSLFKF